MRDATGMTAPPAPRIPILVLGGFLGSGKTTLLRRALSGDPHTAVIINEFGAVGLDHRLLRSCDERIEVVSGGCACCAKREDLVRMLSDLLDDHDRGRAELRRVLIEMSGLADPAPVLFTIGSDPMLRHHFDVQRVTVTVDALNAGPQLAAHPEALKQVLVADELVITKADLVSPEIIARLGSQLAEMNPAASVRSARGGLIDERPEHLADTGGARRQRRRDAPVTLPRSDRRGEGARRPPRLRPSHTSDVRAVCLDAGEAMDWLAFTVWLSMLLQAWGERILRVKGMIELDDGTLVSINGVQHVVHHPEHLPRAQVLEEPHELVFITRGLDTDRLGESMRVFQRAVRPLRAAAAP